MVVLERADAADAGADDAGDPGRVIRQLVGPAGLGQRLVARHHRELREAVGAARLLDREVLLGLVLAGLALSVLDTGLPGEPALVQGAGADTQRGDGADAGDDDLGHPAR